MKEITIYPQEERDGIAETIKSQASIAYCSPANLHKGDLTTTLSNISNEEVRDRVVAENKDQIDLHYLESVLVSTGWNKNDDVFTVGATWEARS